VKHLDGYEIDQILAADEPPSPSPGFAAGVLAEVRTTAAKAATPPPLPFPWRRYLAGLGLLSVLSGVAEWIGPSMLKAYITGGRSIEDILHRFLR